MTISNTIFEDDFSSLDVFGEATFSDDLETAVISMQKLGGFLTIFGRDQGLGKDTIREFSNETLEEVIARYNIVDNNRGGLCIGDTAVFIEDARASDQGLYSQVISWSSRDFIHKVFLIKKGREVDALIAA